MKDAEFMREIYRAMTDKSPVYASGFDGETFTRDYVEWLERHAYFYLSQDEQ